jgi:mono/diheme cytochrome c family protein
MVASLMVFISSCTQTFDDLNKFEVKLDDGTVSINVTYWEQQCESCHKTADIPDTGSLRYWASRSEGSLASYITSTMPYGNPTQCNGDCAIETARYLQAVLTGATIVEKDDNLPTEPSTETGEEISDTETPSEYSAQCESCHSSEKIVTEFAAWKLQNTAELVSYIEMTMPFANAEACIDDCATNTANYIMNVLDAADSNENSDTDSGSDSEEETELVTLPILPTNLTLTQGMNSVTLNWLDNSQNESSFTVWRKVGSNAWSAYKTVAENQTSLVDDTLPLDVISYRVAAVNSAGMSALSNSVEIDLTAIEGGESCSAPQYVAGSTYLSGELVQNEGRYFECKSLVSAWCSSTAAYAYEPVSGLYWETAWDEVLTCSAPVEEPEEETVSLNAPTLLSATITETSVSLRWLDNSVGETDYLVVKSVDGASYALVTQLPADSESYVDQTNEYGTTVKYQVYAKSDSEFSTRLTTSDLVFSNSDFDAAAYYANDCAACHGARGDGTSSGALQVSGFQSSTLSLAEFVSAIDSTMPYGNVSACVDDCATDVANYIFSEFITASNIPEAISGLFIGADSDKTKINISWSDNADNETGFRIERSVNGNDFVTMITLAANVTTHTDTNVSMGNTYQYRVFTFNATDVSQAVVSSELNLEISVTLPAKPTNLSATMDGAAAILTWADNASNETNYVLQQRKNKGTWSADIIVAANQSSYSDSTVAYGNTYDYRVLATNSAGDSNWSDEVTLDLTSTVNRAAYDSNCAGCHKDGGIAVDLLNDFTKQNWADNDWDDFLTKVKTMPTASCDAECQSNAAKYIWSETWGLALSEEVATNSRGVRGLRLLTSYEYLNTVSDVVNYDVPTERLPADRHASDFKFASEAHAGVVIYDRLNEFMLLAEHVASEVSASDIGCSSSCSDSQLETLLEHAFRRSIDPDVLSTYKSFQSTYGQEDLVASILLSPWFLYRTELGEWNADISAYQLDDYEVATALSYQLWGTAPDSTLLLKAEQGALSTQEQIQAQAELMINDAKASEHLIEFVRYYTNTQSDLAEKPNLTTAMITSMESERNESVRYALSQGTATLDELFNPDYSYLNSALATHYGISGVSGSSVSKVSVSDQRGGLLHQGILQVHNSDFTATSLVKRGKLIRENMMCHTMGVPSGVDPSNIDLPEYPISTRERWDIITGPTASEGQCWACHQLMNEPGSVLESYDAAGQYRLTEEAYNDENTNVSIATAGTLRSNDAAESLLLYSDVRDLSEYLANSPVGQDCFVDNYAKFTTGYEPDNLTEADLGRWQEGFRQDGKIWPMVLNSITSESFLYRNDRN